MSHCNEIAAHYMGRFRGLKHNPKFYYDYIVHVWEMKSRKEQGEQLRITKMG